MKINVPLPLQIGVIVWAGLMLNLAAFWFVFSFTTNGWLQAAGLITICVIDALALWWDKLS